MCCRARGWSSGRTPQGACVLRGRGGIRRGLLGEGGAGRDPTTRGAGEDAPPPPRGIPDWNGLGRGKHRNAASTGGPLLRRRWWRGGGQGPTHAVERGVAWRDPCLVLFRVPFISEAAVLRFAHGAATCQLRCCTLSVRGADDDQHSVTGSMRPRGIVLAQGHQGAIL